MDPCTPEKTMAPLLCMQLQAKGSPFSQAPWDPGGFFPEISEATCSFCALLSHFWVLNDHCNDTRHLQVS